MQSLIHGSTLQGGKYIIKKVLGQGGFGVTYLAEHDLLRKQVAIKEFFMKDYCNREESTSHVSVGTDGSVDLVNRFRQKFLSEARKIAHLQHANIIRISDVFEENGTAYYVMDYCEGGSLADLLNENPNGIKEDLALKYIRQVASAIEYVHAQNINHLDIKPANILLDAQDNTILIDFGMSKQYDATGSQTSTTPVGISHGYAAIEQYRQGGVSQFSPATDIYSLGATLYKLITGQTPPEASVIGEDGLPSFFASANNKLAIESAMSFRRSDRPKSISEWLSVLNKADNESQRLTSEQAELKTNEESTQLLCDDPEELALRDNLLSEVVEGLQSPSRQMLSAIEEEAKKKEQERKAAEEEAARLEAIRHAEEVERISREAERRRLEAERLEAERKRSEQEQKAKDCASVKKTIWGIIFVIIALFGVLIWISEDDQPTQIGQPQNTESKTETTSSKPVVSNTKTISYFGTMGGGYLSFQKGYPFVLRLTEASDGKITGWYKNINYATEAAVSGKSQGSTVSLQMQIDGKMAKFEFSKGLGTGTFTRTESLNVKLKQVTEYRFAGKIGTISVHIMLWRNGKEFNGISYYDKYADKKESNYMILKGSGDEELLYIDEYNLKGVRQGYYVGPFSKDAYSGRFKNSTQDLDFVFHSTNEY